MLDVHEYIEGSEIRSRPFENTGLSIQIHLPALKIIQHLQSAMLPGKPHRREPQFSVDLNRRLQRFD